MHFRERKSSDGVVEDSRMGKERDEEHVVRKLPVSLHGALKITMNESRCSKNTTNESER